MNEYNYTYNADKTRLEILDSEDGFCYGCYWFSAAPARFVNYCAICDAQGAPPCTIKCTAKERKDGRQGYWKEM